MIDGQSEAFREVMGYALGIVFSGLGDRVLLPAAMQQEIGFKGNREELSRKGSQTQTPVGLAGSVHE